MHVQQHALVSVSASASVLVCVNVSVVMFIELYEYVYLGHALWEFARKGMQQTMATLQGSHNVATACKLFEKQLENEYTH